MRLALQQTAILCKNYKLIVNDSFFHIKKQEWSDECKKSLLVGEWQQTALNIKTID